MDNAGRPRPTHGHNTLNQRHNELKQSKFCTVFLSVRQRRARQGRTSPPRSPRSIVGPDNRQLPKFYFHGESPSFSFYSEGFCQKIT